MRSGTSGPPDRDEAGRPSPGFRLAVWAFFLLCALAAFGPGLRGEFLNYDDDRTILRNPAFHMGWFEGLLRILDPFRPIADVYLPVTTLDLGIDRLLFGLERTLGYHLHSLLWAVAVAWSLVRLLLELGVPRLVSVFASLPWILHPVLPESVVWITGRKDLCAAFFTLLALRAGLVRLRGPEGTAIWPVWLYGLLAVYSKGTALVLPFLAVLVWFPLGRVGWNRRSRAALLGLAGICLLAGLHHDLLARKAGTMGFEGSLAAVPGTFLHYLGLLVLPEAPAVHYPREAFLAELSKGVWIKALYLSLGSGIALLAAWRGRGVSRRLGVGFLLVLAALLPFNNFLPATAAAAADRYLHLSFLGAGVVLAGLGAAVPARFRTPAVLVFGCALAFLALPATRSRAAAFSSSAALWKANLERFPEDSVALYNLGLAKLDSRVEGAWKEARRLFRKAALHAEEDLHKLKIGVQLLRCAKRAGDDAEAVNQARALTRRVDLLYGKEKEGLHWAWRRDFRLEWAEALERAGRSSEIDPLLEDVLELDPGNPEALAWKARRLLARGSGKRSGGAGTEGGGAVEKEARALLRKASRRPEAESSLQVALAKALLASREGRSVEALGALVGYKRRLLRSGFSPKEELWLAASEIYLAQGLIEGAVRELKEGLSRHPGSPRLLARLGLILEQSSRFEEAARLYRRALRARPLHPGLRKALARVLAALARRKVAREAPSAYAGLVREAASLDPGLPALAYLEAVLLRAERRYLPALARVSKACAQDPGDEAAATLRLDLLKQIGYLELAARKPEAFRRFRKLLDLAPPEYPVGAVREVCKSEFLRRIERGDAQLKEKKLEEAERAYASALELFPDQEGALRKLGMVRFVRGAPEEAVPPLSRALRIAEKLGMDPGLSLLYLLKSLVALGRIREAGELVKPYLPGGARAGTLADPGLRRRILEFSRSGGILEEAADPGGGGGTSGPRKG